MRISDWSSDVCSSDLTRDRIRAILCRGTVAQHFDTLDCARRNEVEIDRVAALRRRARVEVDDRAVVTALAVDQHEDMDARKAAKARGAQIGRASCRERVCQYV